MLNRYQQHDGSKDRGGSPTGDKTVDGVSKLRFNLPTDDPQNRDRIIYQAPSLAGDLRRAVNRNPPANGGVQHEESWSSILSLQIPTFTPSSSYASSSIYFTPSSSQPHLKPSTDRPHFPPTSATPYLTPSTSNPWLNPSSRLTPNNTSTSYLSTFSISSSTSVDAAGDYVPPRNNWYNRESEMTQGFSSHPQQQGKKDTTARAASNQALTLSSWKRKTDQTSHGTSSGSFYYD
jgi:hypothetical protein